MAGNLSTYAGGSSNFIKDPRQLPVMILNEALLYIKTSNSANTFASDANAPTFFAALAKRGAQATQSVADTYVTVANLSGRGRLYSVIPPSNTGAAYTPTVRITVDGQVYTIAPSSTITAAYRMVIGAMALGPGTTTSSGTYNQADFALPTSYNDPGFNLAMVGGMPTGASTMCVVSPEVMEAYAMPFLQFDSSCLIEFKTSLLASGSGDKIGGAVYRMLP